METNQSYYLGTLAKPVPPVVNGWVVLAVLAIATVIRGSTGAIAQTANIDFQDRIESTVKQTTGQT